MEKVKIEKNTVQETLLVPLYGRKMCSEKFPELYTDVFAERLCAGLDYDFTELDQKNRSFLYEFGSLEAAMRQLDIMWEIKEYLKKYPKATVVNLGCGLDETGRACDNGLCQVVNVDFPDVMTVRTKLIAERDREVNIACDLRDDSWMDRVDGTEGVFFFAAGVFHYFKTEEVKALVLKLSERYAGGRLVFDSLGRLGVKLMMSKTLKNMDIRDVKGLFAVDRPMEELNWSEHIQVSTKGYMLGYYDMKSPGVRFSHRLLAKLCDSLMKMAVHRMDFE